MRGDTIYYNFTKKNILAALNKYHYPMTEILIIREEISGRNTEYKISGRGIPEICALEIELNQNGRRVRVDNEMLCNDLISSGLKRIEFYERSTSLERILPPHKYIEVVFTIK